MSNRRYIELYSGNRNRVQYPDPAQFEVPFAPTQQMINGKNAADPLVNGGVYYKFLVDSSNLYAAQGVFQAGSTTSSPVISLSPKNGEIPSTIRDYYVGWYIVDLVIEKTDPNNAIQLITGYNPSTLTLSMSLPFPSDPTGHEYGLYISPPDAGQISIPAVDVNFNSVLNYELAYNGFFLVFESPNASYSNPCNSNIFSRKITYYDNSTRIAYFSEPLPQNYTPGNGDVFTLRQSIPNERWTITAPSYVSNVTVDPVIGPLVGPVITLPSSASSQDNYYVGQFLYYYSNSAYTYPNELPSVPVVFSNTSTPLPGVFYPIYGSYYIKAYNGTTKQLSVCYDINDTPIPTYIPDIGYNSGSFQPEGTGIVITEIAPGTYQAVLDAGGANQTISLLPSGPSLFTFGKTYKICWRIKAKNFNGNPPDSCPDLTFIAGNYLDQKLAYTVLPVDSDEYITYTFCIIPTSDIQVVIYPGTSDAYCIEWDLFIMSETPIINMCSFESDNFTPLSYNGSMVSINETVCYEVNLVSLTLPNESLLSGSRISFYPYVYVEFTNATSPNGASRDLIYSNNPNSKNALFIAATPNQVQPLLSTFVTLSSGGMSQIVKFKPNDNLRFSVYLPDGTLFKTLETDFYSPYTPSGRVQIDALFSIRRI
jgi:hypothetical protein